MIKPYPASVDYPARRGREAIAQGTTLYAIRKGDLYFIWSYTSEAFAKVMDARMNPGNSTDIAANWRRTTRELCPSSRTQG